jgi:aspartate ammonia-lyase
MPPKGCVIGVNSVGDKPIPPAVFYGVETKRVNEAIKNNPDKFPDGYVFEVQNVDK